MTGKRRRRRAPGYQHSNWPADLERARLWYEPHLDRIHETPRPAVPIDPAREIASGYPSRERFLTELTLDPPDATSDQAGVPLLDEDYLILSAIHFRKGQEWKSVYVLNVVDGCMPSTSRRNFSGIEEERRLLYRRDDPRQGRSASDRAAAAFFTHGQHAQGDRHVYASRTRFIPDRLLGLFEKAAWPRAASDAPRKSGAARRPSAPACAECGVEAEILNSAPADGPLPVRVSSCNSRLVPHRNKFWTPQRQRVAAIFEAPG